VTVVVAVPKADNFCEAEFPHELGGHNEKRSGFYLISSLGGSFLKWISWFSAGMINLE